MNFNHDTGLIDTILTIDTTIAPPLGGTTGVLTITGTGGVQLPVGNTAQQPANSAGLIRFNSQTGSLEFNNGTAWSGAGGSVTSVAITGGTGLSVSGSPITGAGTITLTLNTELQGLAGVSANGSIHRTAAGTYASRTLTGTAGRIGVTNGDGVAGNPTFDLATVTDSGTGNFRKVSVDTYGRVTGTQTVAVGDITAALGYTPVNKAGDTMSGTLTFSAGTVTGLATPSAATDAATKAYVDSVSQGLDPKGSVRAATTTAGTLASSFANGSVIDGVTLTTGDRILIKNQAAPAENGIYTVNASGAPTRAADMDAWTEVPGAFVFIEEGTSLGDTGWVCSSNQGGTLGTTAITFVQFSGAGAYTAGTGLTLSGTQFSLTTPVVAANGGTGLSSLGTANQMLGVNSGATGLEYKTINQGTGITVAHAANSITITNAGVTSAVAGTGIGVSGATGAVTITNNGVTSVAGTANQITASASTGAVTLSLPANVTTTNLTLTGLTANSFLISGTGGALTTTAAPTNGQLLIGSTGAAPVAATLTQGSGITVTNGAGTITIANAGVTSVSGTANEIEVSSATGSVTIGLPNNITVSGATVSGLNANSFLYSGTGGALTTTAAPTNGQILIGSTGAAPVAATLTQGTGITITNGAGTVTVANAGVTSFTQTVPSIMSITGASAATGAVSSAISLATQTANVVFAGPTSSSAVPTFRALVYNDLPIKLFGENQSAPTAPSATGTNAVAIGSGSAASATGSFGVGDGASASLFGSKAYANGKFATAGDAQSGLYVVRNSTTDATLTELFLDGAAGSQRMVVGNNSVWTFDILVSARRTDATGGGAGYRFMGVLRKDTTAGSITFIGTPSKQVLGETNTAWDAAVSVDTTNGSLRVRVTGEAAKTIRWVAVVHTSEVTN